MTGSRYDIPDVWYQQPIYYKGNRLTFIGNNQDVLWPDYADYLDIELELAIIISQNGKNISKEDAPNYIFGYSILRVLYSDLSGR